MKKILIVISIMFSALWVLMPKSYASLDAEEELDILRVELFDNGFRFYGDNEEVMINTFSNLYDYKENDELIINISGNEIIDRFKITINKDRTILHFYNSYDNKKDYFYSGQISLGVNFDVNNNRYYYDIYFVGYSYTEQTEEYLELNKIYPVIVNSIYSDFNKGKEEGKTEGFIDGKTEGYNEGKSDGITEGRIEIIEEQGGLKLALLDFLPGVLGSIFMFFFTIGSMSMLGISLLDILLVIFGIGAVLFIIKLFFK